MAKDTYYFSHDYNARQDEKIKRLIRKHGFLGYGIFWAIIEDLYNNTNVLRTDNEGYANEFRTNEDVINSIMNDFDLFVFEGEYFGSRSIENRINERNEKSKKARESVMKRWDKINTAKESNTNELRTNYEGNTIKKGKKLKERKEIKEIPPEKEFLDYCKTLKIDYQNLEFGIKAKYDTWVTAGWKDGFGKDIINWKNTIRNVMPHIKPLQQIQTKSTYTPPPPNPVKKTREQIEEELKNIPIG